MANPAPDAEDRQLSLFEAPSGASPAVAAGEARSAAQAPGAAPADPAGDRPRPPPRFHHPRTERRIALGEHEVGYAFRRARRRSIGLSIGTEGLAVAAPRWVSIAEVEQALRAKAGWILRKLHEQHERAGRLQAARIEWRDGTTLPFLGETVIVVLDPRVSGAVLNRDGVALPGLASAVLHVGLPQTASQAQIREAVQSWLQRQARQLFEARCAHFAPRLGVTVRRIGLSSAATRWGSASGDGSVRLHWRLVHFALPVIDYVVTHELAHLREMNHSAAFWEVVRSVLPDFERRRGELRAQQLPAFD